MSKGIIPTIMEQAGHSNEPGEIVHLRGNPEQYTIYTSAGGMACMDFAFAEYSSIPPARAVLDHPPFLWGDRNRQTMVDEKGTEWMWGMVAGKKWWIHLGSYASKKRPKYPTRFIKWEQSLNQ